MGERMDTPRELKYNRSHEWVKAEGQTVTVGISDFAQEQLGDVVYVELPEVGKEVKVGDAVAAVESVKTASDIYSPVSGEIAEVNGALEDTPEKVNESPYESWLFKVKAADPSELDDLLDADAYRKFAEESE
jgi:glycine cleavage system H protein